MYVRLTAKNSGTTVFNVVVTLLAFVNVVVSGVFSIKIYNVEEEPISGSAVELCSLIQTTILWIIVMIYSFAGGDRAMTSFGTVKNANLFHSIWIGFGTVVTLNFEFIKAFRDFNIIDSIQERGSRFGHWILLLLTSFTVMTASTLTFVQTNCQHPEESSIHEGFQETRTVDINVDMFCTRTALAVGLGAISVVICIMFISELLYVHESPEQLFESEALFSSLLAVSFSVATGFIMSDNGPGTYIGNLYYATWWSLFISLMLTASCFREYQDKKTAMTAGDG
jgi:hypothetical protein